MSFYKIDFSREIVLNGEKTAWINIARDNQNNDIPNKYDIYAMIFPSTQIFKNYGTFKLLDVKSTPITNRKILVCQNINSIGLEGIKPELLIKESHLFFNNTANIFIQNIDLQIKNIYQESDLIYFEIEIHSSSIAHFDETYAITNQIYVQIGEWESDDCWAINNRSVKDINLSYYQAANNVIINNSKSPFDGTSMVTLGDLFNTGFFSRLGNNGWIKLPYDQNDPEKPISIKISYNGQKDSHLGLKILIFRIPYTISPENLYFNLSSITPFRFFSPMQEEIQPLFGLNTPDGGKNPWIDVQECHIFGYQIRDSIVKNVSLSGQIKDPLFGEKVSLPLYRTNPKLSGNLKLTIDSNEELWFNSFDANPQLSQARYKKWSVKANSDYSLDIFNYLKGTPKEIFFQLFENDPLLLSTKRDLDKKYDNFYCAGPQQLKNKYYSEQYSYLAPIWLESILPEWFIIWRIPTKIFKNSKEKIDELLKSGSIVKSFSLKEDSNIGKYLRNIQKNISKPIEVNYEDLSPTYWNGIDISSGAITKKTEYLSDYYKKDRPLIEFEEYITSGFERNGIVVQNLLNLEFLFTDSEANDFETYNYIGLYLSENNILEFNVDYKKLSIINQDTNFPKNSSQILNLDYWIEGDPIKVPINLGDTYINQPIGHYLDDNIISKRLTYLKSGDNIWSLLGVKNNNFEIGTKKLNVPNLLKTDQISYQSQILRNGDGLSRIDIYIDNTQDQGNILLDEEELIVVQTIYRDEDRTKNLSIICVDNTSPTTKEIVIYSSLVTKSSSFIQPFEGESVIINVENAALLANNSLCWITNVGKYKIIGIDVVNNTVTICNIGDTTIPPLFPVPNSFISLSEECFRGVVPNDWYVYNQWVTIDLSNIAQGDAYRIKIKDLAYDIENISPTINTIDIKLNIEETYSKWKLIANSAGVQPGDWWNYPVYDTSQECWINTFSPEGTVKDVSNAIVGCINSFENIPIVAKFDGEKILIVSKEPDPLNSIYIKRIGKKGSSVYNLSWLTRGNVDIIRDLMLSNGIVNTITNIDINYNYNLINEETYFVKLIKNGNSAVFQIRTGCDLTNILTAESTGTLSIVLVDNILNQPNIPFTINISDYSNGVWVCGLTFSSRFREQYLIGGANNSIIVPNNEIKPFLNIETKNAALLSQNGNIITVGDNNIKIGEYLFIQGVNTGIWVKSIINNSLILSDTPNLENINLVTFSKSYPIGQNRYDLWAKSKRDTYFHVKRWNSQNNPVYIIPNWEGDGWILSLEGDSPFNPSSDKRISLYSVQRQTVGVFSIFPLCNFSFDHFLSQWTNSPANLEINKYFKVLEINNGDELELELFEDYVIQSQDTSPFTIKIKILDNTNNWIDLTDLEFQNWGGQGYFNTYFPYWSYDPLQRPWEPNPNQFLYSKAYGFGDFQEHTLWNGNDFIPKKIKIKVIGTGPWTVEKKYKKDKDILNFTGFSNLREINSLEDEIRFRNLIEEGKFIEAFSISSDSEYLYLKEPYIKELATKSKVVPYINKWVSYGTDARGLPYRLNVHKSFGNNNFSPNDYVVNQDPSLLTHEFFYLDGVPNTNDLESIINSKSYLINRLDDIEPTTGTKWIDLLLTDESNDWFSKFFVIGNLDYKGEIIQKTRDERFTFFYKTNTNIYETIFRGAKIQISSEQDLSDWKFSAVLKIQKYRSEDFGDPISIRFHKNQKYKSILMLCILKIEDYKFDRDLTYTSLYTVNDIIKSIWQKQYRPVGFNDVWNPIDPDVYGTQTNILSTLPYRGFNWYFNPILGINNAPDLVYKARQGFFGSSYFDLEDIRVPSKINSPLPIPLLYSPLPTTINFDLLNTLYQFSPSNDISPIKNLYRDHNNIYIAKSFSTAYNTQNPPNLPIISNFWSVVPSHLELEGGLFSTVSEFRRIGISGNIVEKIILHRHWINGNFQILPDSLIYNFSNRPIIFRTTPGSLVPAQVMSIANNFNYASLNNNDITASWLLKGGTGWGRKIMEKVSFSSIKEFVNSGVWTANADIEIKFINNDTIIKNSVLIPVIDEDKPAQYIGEEIIGFNILNTEKREIIYRHRGFYKPLIEPLFGFEKEDRELFNLTNDSHFLRNTKFIDTYDIPICVNKVSDTEILKIDSNTSYKPNYPWINEIAFFREIIDPLNDNLSPKFYTKFITIDNFVNVNGWEEETEIKTVFGKLLKVPDVVNIEIFNNIKLVETDKEIIISLDYKLELLQYLLKIDTNSFQFLNGIVNDLEQWKINYYQKNILDLYELDKIQLWSKESDAEIGYSNITVEKRLNDNWTVEKGFDLVDNLGLVTINKLKPFGKKKSYSLSLIMKRI